MIDVIIPIYNTPVKDLKRCFDSIIRQTYDEWCVYLIDDGSNETTKNWLDKFVKSNSKFYVKHIDNGGVSNARNVGLSLSKGEYITFCDADDSFDVNFFKQAIDIMNKNNVDMVIGGVRLIYSDHDYYCVANKDYLYTKDNINELFEYMVAGVPVKDDEILNNIYAGRTIAKLYKKSLLSDVRLDVSLFMHEDNLFSIDVFDKCNSVYVTSNVWYNYYQNDYSVTHIKYSDELLEQELLFIDKLLMRIDIFEKNNLMNSLKLRISNIIFMYIQRLSYSDKSLKDGINNIDSLGIFNYIRGLNYNKYKNIKNLKKFIYRVLLINNKKVRNSLLVLFIKIYRLFK